MARKLRVQYPGAIYHLLNRGDRREAIFLDDKDRKCFLDSLGEVCEKTGWQVHAFCLMPNHFHLVVETPQGNLVPGMKWCLGVYSGSHGDTRHLGAVASSAKANGSKGPVRLENCASDQFMRGN
jgi:putative transposase